MTGVTADTLRSQVYGTGGSGKEAGTLSGRGADLTEAAGASHGGGTSIIYLGRKFPFRFIDTDRSARACRIILTGISGYDIIYKIMKQEIYTVCMREGIWTSKISEAGKIHHRRRERLRGGLGEEEWKDRAIYRRGDGVLCAGEVVGPEDADGT